MAYAITLRGSIPDERARMMTVLARMGPVVFSAIFAVLMLAAPAVRADDKTAARDHWERGTKFYDLGKYDDAIREFEAAYEAKSDPAFLYNLAQSHRLAGHPSDALRFYRTYLRYVPKAPNRADIENHIKELEKTAADRPATEPAAATPPPLVPTNTPPPASTAPAATPTPAPTPTPASPPADSTTPPPANAYPYGPPPTTPPAASPQAPPASDASSAPPHASGRRTAGVVIAASGAGLFVVGAIFGLVARSQSKKVETAAANNDRFDPSVESLGKTSQTLQWVGYGIGLAGIAAGLFLYATAPAATESAAPPRVAIASVVSQDSGGALLRVTF